MAHLADVVSRVVGVDVEVGEVAALVASDRAGPMTGAAVNITCGQIDD